jgi:AbrB family looped-hinge helix DNA binding protein
MDQVTVSSKGQIAIPKAIRDAMNLAEGTKLTVQLRGQELVFSKRSRWRELEGSAAGSDLMSRFAASKKEEREREDSRP